MSPKFLVMFGLTIGSLIGGYIPTFFGADFLSPWSIIGDALGGLVGIYIAYKISF